MTGRLIRWALWSPSHLAVVAAGMLVVLAGLALVFRPSPGDAQTPSSAGTGTAVASATPSPSGSSASTSAGASTTAKQPPATAADAGTIASSPATKTVEGVFRNFTTAWLSGLGALTVPGWVEDVCKAGCTPYLRQMLGTVSPTAIPDADLVVVKVDSVGEAQAVGRAQLSDGQWVKLTAEWDGERWLVSGIESA